MRRLQLDELGSLKPGSDSAELRFTNRDGNTEVWIIPRTPVDSLSLLVQSVGSAYIDNGVDSRLALQIETINRLLAHVKEHCPDFAGGRCYFEWEGDKK